METTEGGTRFDTSDCYLMSLLLRVKFDPLSRNCLSSRVPALEQTFESFSLPSSSIFNYLFNKILLKQLNIPYSI